jgi:uncharacterized protein YeaO (DUF488 family)
MGMLKKIPNTAYKIFICRYLPKTLQIDHIPNTQWNISLAPSYPLFKKYKAGACTWAEFEEEYERQMTEDSWTKSTMKSLAIFINEHPGEDVFLICYEADPADCHRTFLGRRLAKEYQIEVIEWNGGNSDGSI